MLVGMVLKAKNYEEVEEEREEKHHVILNVSAAETSCYTHLSHSGKSGE